MLRLVTQRGDQQWECRHRLPAARIGWPTAPPDPRGLVD